MDGKLYIFGIGGTGARVIKSFVMLAASGIEINAKAIVPIIIDPDFSNKDITKTVDLMDYYIFVRKYLSYNSSVKNKFFSTSIDPVIKNYRLGLKDTKDKKFKEFIKYSSLGYENKALASILFSENNLESDMEVGFKGNPNIGSVVLNQFTESSDFLDFASGFKKGDRIFIISSIFGGTGASGFPLLLKNLRELQSIGTNNYHAIQTSPIGAVSVLPYFDVEPDERENAIDSSTFIGKTKAALQYYDKNISGDQAAINVLYYIGDKSTKKYEYHDGGLLQENNAHFIELASALSIIDFANYYEEDSAMLCETDNQTNKIYVPKPEFKEFGIDKDEEHILFENLTQETKDIICFPMTQFTLFSKYVKEHLDNALKQPWAKDHNIDKTFIKSSFIHNIKNFTKQYILWLKEMADNIRGFEPYNLSVTNNNLFDIVKGVKPAPIRSLWAFNKSGYDLFDTALDEKQKYLSNNLTTEQKFIELFYCITKDLVERKFRF